MEKVNRPPKKVIWKNVFILAVAGGLAFWVTNFAISRTPIAAEYRATLSIPYLPMLLAALIASLLIGSLESYFLLHFFDRLPAKSPIVKSLILSGIVLILVTILAEAPGKFLGGAEHMLRYFLIGTSFNFLRILALGIGIGYLYKRLFGSV
jgi:hypothetical protein